MPETVTVAAREVRRGDWLAIRGYWFRVRAVDEAPGGRVRITYWMAGCGVCPSVEFSADETVTIEKTTP